jgi:hypothetical protein
MELELFFEAQADEKLLLRAFDMWNFDEIRNAIDLDMTERVKPMLLGLSDFGIPLGIGIGENGSVVLIVPGEEFESPANGKYFSFDPWTTIHPEGSDSVSGVGVLSIRFPAITENEKNALASLFLGIVQMQKELGSRATTSRVIKSLSRLFESRLRMDVPKGTIVGLTGELLAICRSRDLAFFVSSWRSLDTNRYDFSSNKYRLEVKTSTQFYREHTFSSHQLPSQHGCDLAILSVIFHEVEEGMSFSDLFTFVWKQITDEDLKSKLLNVCVETLGNHPSFIDLPKFDLENSLASFALFSPGQIPTPAPVPGVTHMNWTAVLSDDLPFDQKLNENKFAADLKSVSL